MHGRRRYLILIAALLLIFGGALILQGVLFPTAPRDMEVLSVRGDVSVLSPDGLEAVALAAGARVRPGDAVRTGLMGEAVMRGEGSSTITVTENSSIAVEGVVDGVSRLRLDQGRVIGQVTEGDGTGIQVTGGNDGAEALTRGGKMAVGIDGAGDLAVAAIEGKAQVTQGDVTTDVNEGELAVASGGSVSIGAIPTSVLLKVAWPEESRTRKPTTLVRVEAGPGSNVRVNDEPVPLDRSGKGVIEVKLEEGGNDLRVEATDVVGNRTEEKSDPIVLDTRPPEIGGGAIVWEELR